MSSEELLPPLELGPGAMLARARAARQLGVADVADRLKYARRQIEALEAENFAALPGHTIVRGMMRSYAKLVGVDSAPVLDAFERRNAPAPASMDVRAESIPFPDGDHRSTRVYLGLSGVALLGIAAVFYEWHIGGGDRVPAQVAAPIKAAVPARTEYQTVSPDLPVPAEAAPVPGAGDRVRKWIQLDFQKESWVEIKDGSGIALLSQLNLAGTRQVVAGTPPFVIVIGNAANVRLTYDDVPVDLRPYVKVEVARLTLE